MYKDTMGTQTSTSKTIRLPLGQWFSTFQMTWPFNQVPFVEVTPNHKDYFFCHFIIVICYCYEMYISDMQDV